MCARFRRSSAAAFLLILTFHLTIAGCFKKQEKDLTGAGQPLFTLTGKVFDGDNDRLVQGAVVEIKALGLRDTVDANGTYHFENLKVGLRSLDISAPHYAATTAQVNFAYEQRDVVQDIAMTKLLEVVFSGELPFSNASGVWWEEQQLFITRFDTLGGNLYRLDENLNVQQVSPHFGTLFVDTCFVRVDTCFWQQGACRRSINPNNPFTPDSITTDSVFVDCEQRLYGLTRAEGFFYTTDGRGHFSGPYSLTPIHVFKIDPQTLGLADLRTLNYLLGGATLQFISDLAWDGSGVWLCNRDFSNFPKVNAGDFSLRAVFASPFANATGLASDGRYMWISSGTNIVQFDFNRGVRNHYRNSSLSNDYIAWDGTHLWSIHGGTRHIYKLALPFEDHL